MCKLVYIQTEQCVLGGVMSDSYHSLDQQIGKRLRAARIASGMSVSELSERAQCTADCVKRFESGSSRIGAESLFAFAKALNVEIRWIFGQVEQSDNKLEKRFQYGEILSGIRSNSTLSNLCDQMDRAGLSLSDRVKVA